MTATPTTRSTTRSNSKPLTSRHPELGSKDLIRLHGKLREELQRALGLLEHDLQEGRTLRDTEPEDFAGHASLETTRDQIFSLSEAERDKVRHIEEALERLSDGSFGLCEHDEEPIPIARLEAVPWATYCVEHEELAERGKLEG